MHARSNGSVTAHAADSLPLLCVNVDRKPPGHYLHIYRDSGNSAAIRLNVANEQRETALESRKMFYEQNNVDVAALDFDCYFHFGIR